MIIDVDEKSGFCSGVVRAVEMAEKNLGKGGKLYSLGNIVHNDLEVGRLSGKGLVPLTYGEFRKLENATVLIRAHGEPPETFKIAAKNNIRLIDATCPVVKRLQLKIGKRNAELKESGGQVLIFGKKDHPEVRALVGQTEGQARVIRFPSDLENLDLNRPVDLYSQTTMNDQEFEEILDLVEKKMKKQGADPGEFLEVHNTICRQVSSKESHLREFAAMHDMILFVSSKKSSNGQVLFSICKEVNPESHFITRPEDIDNIDLEGKESIGISGATSTPGWLIMDVAGHLQMRAGKSKSY